MANYVETFPAKMDWGKPFQRTGQLPLDRSSIFSSYADAVKYASGVANSDSRKLAASSYVGQIITVYENSVVTVYKIEENRTLAEVGRSTEGDGKSITLSNGILSLFGFNSATAGQQLRVVNKGTAEAPDLQLEWFTPDTSTVEGLSTTVGSLKETVEGVTAEDGTVTKEGLTHRVNGLEATVGDETKGLVKDVADLKTNKADADKVYTKLEIDGKLTGALHYKGTHATFQELLDSTTAETDPYVPTAGDVWNITTAGGTDAAGVAIKAGDNVIYNGTGWDVSSGAVDLSGYYTSLQIDKTLESYYTSLQVDDELGKKVDKADGYRLMSDAEGTRLAEVSKVEASEVNGNIKLEGEETTVYTLPTATADVLGGVKSSAEKDKVAVGTDGVMTLNKVSADKIEGVVAEAAKVSKTLTVGVKTFNGSADVTIVASDLITDPDKLVRTTNIASEVSVGVVKAGAAQDQVSVGTDGVMTVNDISASKVKGVVAEATKVTNVLTAGEKTFDGSAAVTITAEDLGAMKTAAMGDYVKYENIATADKAGVVKSSAEKDKVAVGTDGVMTLNKVSADKIEGTVSNAADAEKLGGVASGDILNGTSGQVKSAAAADKLASAQNISLTGDATGTASFDGTAAANIEVTLKSVGTAGTYTKVTTDAQGRVTVGATLEAADIPDLTLAKITDAGKLAGKDNVARTDLAEAVQTELNELGGKAHKHENEAVLEGITASKVSGWDNAANKIADKADKATTLAGYGITDAYTKTEIDGKVAGAFHFMGTYATFAALTAAVDDGTITPLAGHVYNITTGGGTDMNGVTIKSGDNVAYVAGETSGWDVLSGTMDMSAYSTTVQIDEKLKDKADKDVVDGLLDNVGGLMSTVGHSANAETGAEATGLVKTVGEHTGKISALETNVDNLMDTVGHAANAETGAEASGLVKAVAENTAAIGVLNGDENTNGSVRKLIAASATTINNAITDITKDGGTIDTKAAAAVATHNTAADAHADLFAAKQNKAVHATMTFEVADFVENTDGDTPYKATKAVTGLAADKNYAPNIAPDVASCNIVTAAGFYPTAVVENGTLTLYCRTAPTAAIVVSGTFTEIQ